MMKTIRRRHLILPMLSIVFSSIACFASAADADATVAPIPFKRESTTEDSGVPRLLIGFGVVAVALAASLYVLRRRLADSSGEISGAKHLRVLETKRLTPRSTLFVVEFAGSRYLIAESGQGIIGLGTVPPQAISTTGQVQ